jgi:C1A family cysteine protease
MNEYGLIKSLPDSRDFIYSNLKSSVSLPSSFAYPETPLRNQGKRGTCVGFGSANMRDVQELSDSLIQVSPLFIYLESKKIDGLPAGTEGTTLKAALTVLKNIGVCPESDLPYTEPNFSADTSTLAQNATKGKISAYARVYTIEEIKQAIYQDGPVLIGCSITQQFRDLPPSENVFIKSLFGGQMVGGHCMSLHGWDDSIGAFKLKNSWADWGNINGYAWMSYNCVTERSIDLGMGMFNEAFTSVDIKTGFTGQKIEMWIDNKRVKVNGVESEIDVPATIMNGRTLAPVRWIFEKAGYTVQWDAVERKVTALKG